MLVLGRKKNERIMLKVGDEVIVITAVDFNRDRARIGIEASRNVIIHREEVWNDIAEHPKTERRLPDSGREGGVETNRESSGRAGDDTATRHDRAELPGGAWPTDSTDDRTNPDGDTRGTGRR